MTAPKLPFLWPMLFKPVRTSRIGTAALHESTGLSTRTPRRTCRQFATTPRPRKESIPQRYGKAHEPAPHLRDVEAVTQSDPDPENKSPQTPVEEADEEDEAATATTTPPSTPTPQPPSTPTEDAAPQPAPTRPPDPPKPALDSVLHMPGPQDEAHRPPHLKTPPYVHHFDTYGLVRELQKSTYTPAQSTLLMKAVRGILMSNLALARAGLVSKSNVENESYLFRAACSELGTEIGNARKAAIERMRTERTQLQHEVDILGQRLGQETGTLRDEVKGLFDDRKMAVRVEQRGMESTIQELNYKITVALNSDMRTEVEALRWVLTRRAAITVGVSAFVLFVALRYTSYVQHQQQEERKRGSPKNTPHDDGNSSSNGNSSNGPPPVYDAALVTGRQEALGGEILAGEGVSLG